MNPRRAVLAACLLSLAACAKKALPELQALYAAEQAERGGRPLPEAELWSREEARLKAVLSLQERGRIRSPEEKFLAAALLAHGHSPEQFLLGHRLALESAQAGWRESRWLAANNEDRWRVATGRPQVFGTQLDYDEKAGRWRLYPVDDSLTDEERARWDVRPLAESRKLAQQLNREGVARFAGRLERSKEQAILDEIRASSSSKKAVLGP